jgi:hypothetical protein
MEPATAISREPITASTGVTHKPDWLKRIDQQALQDICNLQHSICKAQEAVRKLRIHIAERTIPACLKSSLKVSVAAPEQAELDQLVTEATVNFQMTVLSGLLTAREAEVTRLVTDQINVTTTRHHNVQSFTQRLDAVQLAPPAHILAGWTAMFLTQRTAKVQEILLADFVAKNDRLVKEDARLAARAEARLNQELEDPNTKTIQALQARIVSLENAQKQGSKNVKPTVSAPATAGPSRGPNKTKATPPAKTSGPSKPPPKTPATDKRKKAAPGPGNTKRQSASKPSTRQ